MIRSFVLVVCFVFYVLFMYEAGRLAGIIEASASYEAVKDD